MKLYNKDFRNAYLMFGIMAAMFLYMGVSLFIVGEKVGNNRSCIVTCDVDLQSDRAKNSKPIMQKTESATTSK